MTIAKSRLCKPTPEIAKIKKKILTADIVSFDIFDTLLLRPFLNPKDVFYQLEIANKKTGFADARVQAEGAAWEKLVNKDKDDVTLDEIYSFLPKKYRDMKGQELQMEYDNLFVNPEMKDVFDFAIRHNKRVIITSDMYLPYDFIYRVITRELGTNKFKLFVSCEYGKRKHTGKLFEYILSKLNVPANKIVHIGDNIVSDYKVPRSLGLGVCLYTKPADKFLSDNKIKKFYKTHDSLTGRNFLGVMSLGYTHFKDNKNLSYWQTLGFLYGGPLAYTYVRKILMWCATYKLSDIAFVARDGYTLKQIFDILNTNNHVKSHYIYAPRFTNTLAYLDMGAKSVSAERKTVLLKFLSENGVNAVPNDILSIHEKALMRFSDTEQKEYKKYIAHHKFGNRVGLVDSISGSYSAQKLVSKSLAHSDIIGFYWWTLPTDKKDTLPQQQFYTGPRDPYFCHLIEFFFAAPEKPIRRVLNGTPIYKEDINKYEQIKIDLYPTISDAMVDFCKIMLNLNLTPDVDDELIFDWIGIFVSHANKIDYAHFKNIKNGIDQSHTKYVPVLPQDIYEKHPLRKIFREIRHLFFRKKKTDNVTKIYIMGINVITFYREQQ